MIVPRSASLSDLEKWPHLESHTAQTGGERLWPNYTNTILILDFEIGVCLRIYLEICCANPAHQHPSPPLSRNLFLFQAAGNVVFKKREKQFHSREQTEIPLIKVLNCFLWSATNFLYLREIIMTLQGNYLFPKGRNSAGFKEQKQCHD